MSSAQGNIDRYEVRRSGVDAEYGRRVWLAVDRATGMDIARSRRYEEIAACVKDLNHADRLDASLD